MFTGGICLFFINKLLLLIVRDNMPILFIETDIYIIFKKYGTNDNCHSMACCDIGRGILSG